MASATIPRPRTTSSSRSARAQPGRLRGTAQRATTIARPRRKQEPNGLRGLIAKLPDAIPGVTGARKRSRSSSMKTRMSRIAAALPFGAGAKRGKSSAPVSGKRAGGAALAAGAAGLAVKNRRRITSMMKRDGSREEDTTAAAGATGTQDASVSRLDVTPSDVTTPGPASTG